jgi:hypothetical protein
MAVNYPRVFRALLPERERLDAVVRRFLPLARGKCPECGGEKIYPSRLKGQYETHVLPLLFRRPFRCNDCGGRHYNFGFQWLSAKRIMQAMVVLGLTALLVFAILKTFEGGPASDPSEESRQLRTPKNFPEP